MKRLYSIIVVTLVFTGLAHAGERAFSDSTDNNITILSNDLSPLLGTLAVNGHNYNTLKSATIIRGKQCFEFDVENNLRVKAWLITADSAALPYVPVTRGEYLVLARNELKNFTHSTALSLIDSLLRNSTPQQLSQPAVVSVKAFDFRGFEDGKTNATTLVRLNPAYFAAGVQAPKCLLICWRYDPAHSDGAMAFNGDDLPGVK